ncbi:MAG: DNA-processing protein DprA [Chthoniobacterales bacterium]|nr:DNA-processing protein DprA [Chthoniobacterales bacterium]
MTETEACVLFNLLPRVGPVRFARLKKHFGSAVAVLRASRQELCHVEGVGGEVAASIKNWEQQIDLAAEMKRIAVAGASVIIASDAQYPSLLREIYDPPVVLYLFGKLEEHDQRHGIAIVGTRNPSHYAMEVTKKLSYQLAYAGLTIYSGLARGVDTLAHQGALAAQGRTIAVLGSGLGELYPPENELLAEKIATAGAVITELPMQAKPSPQSFPRRNRIISGCSFGVLVVEARLKSGALITAHQAVEQGRSLYAIPGKIDQPTALGTNRLIQQGAKLVIDAQDILQDLSMVFSQVPELSQSQAKVVLQGEDLAIYQAIGEEGSLIDAIIEKSCLPPATVSSRLLALELGNHVRSLAGNRFVKLL